MTTHDTILAPVAGQLLITQEDVIRTVKREIILLKLDEAIARFQIVSYFFRNQPGWNETQNIVENIFIQERAKENHPPPPPQPITQITNDNRQITMMGSNTVYNENLKSAL